MTNVIFEVERGKTSTEYIMYIKKNVKRSRAGCLSVYTDKKESDYLFVGSSFLETRFRNKGYGKCLYEHVIKSEGSLKTCFHCASDEAQNVWKSLSKKYKSKKDFFKGTLTLYNKLK
jgi:hypothetical protein